MLFTNNQLIKSLKDNHNIDVVKITHDDSQGVYSTFMPYTVRFMHGKAECVRVGANLNEIYDRIVHDFSMPQQTIRQHSVLIDALVEKHGGNRVGKDSWVKHIPIAERDKRRGVHSFHIDRCEDTNTLTVAAHKRHDRGERESFSSIRDVEHFMRQY